MGSAVASALLSEDVLSEEEAPLWPQAANTVMHSSMASKQNSGYFLHLKRSFLLRHSAAEIVREFVSANSIIVAQKGAHCQRIVNFLRDFSF